MMPPKSQLLVTTLTDSCVLASQNPDARGDHPNKPVRSGCGEDLTDLCITSVP